MASHHIQPFVALYKWQEQDRVLHSRRVTRLWWQPASTTWGYLIAKFIHPQTRWGYFNPYSSIRQPCHLLHQIQSQVSREQHLPLNQNQPKVFDIIALSTWTSQKMFKPARNRHRPQGSLCEDSDMWVIRKVGKRNALPSRRARPQGYKEEIVREVLSCWHLVAQGCLLLIKASYLDCSSCNP
jgi:hypothetical protein